MKFGGTSVEDTQAFRNVAELVRAAGRDRPVVVVSAIAGFTNALISSAERAIRGDARGATRSLAADFERHLSIARELLSTVARASFESAIANSRSQIRQLHKIIAAHPVTSPGLQDELLALAKNSHRNCSPRSCVNRTLTHAILTPGAASKPTKTTAQQHHFPRPRLPFAQNSCRRLTAVRSPCLGDSSAARRPV